MHQPDLLDRNLPKFKVVNFDPAGPVGTWSYTFPSLGAPGSRQEVMTQADPSSPPQPPTIHPDRALHHRPPAAYDAANTQSGNWVAAADTLGLASSCCQKLITSVQRLSSTTLSLQHPQQQASSRVEGQSGCSLSATFSEAFFSE